MITVWQKITLLLLRLSLGWMFFYAGITKVINPDWSSAGYLKGAKTMIGMYQWFLQPDILPTIDWVNKWALTLLGISLILGIFVRISSILGALLMLLYYLPLLNFPYPNANSYIVDQHIIYIAVLMFMAAIGAGRIWGLDAWCANLPLCSRYPRIRKLFG